MSHVPAFIFFQDGSDFGVEIELEKGFLGAAAGPGAEEAGLVAAAEPVGDLLDGGLFEVVGEWGLAGSGGGTGEDVAAGVRHPQDQFDIDRGQ